jgi:chromate transporter
VTEGGRDGVDAPGRLAELASLFLKLGVIGFGGPAAHIAMMRDEVVRRRQWMDDDELLDLVGATNLIPGPNSTELAIHLGQQRAGGRGLVVAGACFIGPSVVMVGFLAWLYERYGTDPALLDLRYGVLPVIIAVVANALYILGRRAVTSVTPGAIAAAAIVAYLAGVHELVVLAVGGLVALAAANRHRIRPAAGLGIVGLPLLASEAGPAGQTSLWRLFLVFLEIGSVLYGSGYVLLAFLQRNLVDQLGWLSREELLDAVAVGQVTPGPVFTTATFVGWQVEGPAGALVATIGIFLPSFVFVALLSRIVPWMRANPDAAAFLSGVTAASLGLMAGVLVELTTAAIVDLITAALAVVALALLVRTNVNSAWLIASGVAIGLFQSYVG